MKKRTVAVTGIGLVTPLGHTTTHTWQATINGISGITCYPVLNQCFPAGICPIDYRQLSTILTPQEIKKTDRFTHLALAATNQIMSNYTTYPHDMGVIIGVGIGGLATTAETGLLLAEKGRRSISPFTIPRSINNMAANWISLLYNLKGPSFALTNACASGADAIGTAYQMIKHGIQTTMLAGGTESCINPVAFVAFDNMKALAQCDTSHDTKSTISAHYPEQASCPFSLKRRGFVLAEGAGMLLLEDLEHAQKRNATIYGTIQGYGSSSDAYHITAMHPESNGGIHAYQKALQQAECSPESIGYINAHGTSTSLNDKLETSLVHKIYSQEHINTTLRMSSTKSMTGHMIGASGAVEAGITLKALGEQIVPPTINLMQQDPDCDLNYVANKAQKHSFEYAASHSFGFGGSNTILIFKQYKQ